MPVKNIECQIATSQIGRYLAGEALSSETMKQLEGHIADCDDCRAALIERKAALQAMLSGSEPSPTAVVQAPVPNPMAKALRQQAEDEKAQQAEIIAEQIRAAQAAKAQIKEPLLTKPILLTMALAGVLMAMSFLAKMGIVPFGPKADSAFETSKPINASPAPVVSKPKAGTPPASKPAPTAVDKTSKPTPPPSAAKKSDAKQPTAKPANANSSATVVKPAPTTGKVTPSRASTLRPKVKSLHRSHRAKTHRRRRSLAAGTGTIKIYR